MRARQRISERGSDDRGIQPIQRQRVYDATSAAGSGYWKVNGSTIAAGTVVALSAAQFAQTTYVAGNAGISDTVSLLVYDGQAYSGSSFSSLSVNASTSTAPLASSGLIEPPDPFPMWTPSGTDGRISDVQGLFESAQQAFASDLGVQPVGGWAPSDAFVAPSQGGDWAATKP